MENLKIDENNTEIAVVPIPNVRYDILLMVIEFCTHHVHEYKPNLAPKSRHDESCGDNSCWLKMLKRAADNVEPTYAEFFKVNQNTLMELIMAANFLNIRSLFDIACKAVAQLFIGKSTEEIRTTFNIKNDFTPEEEEQVCKENTWCDGMMRDR